MERPFVSEQTTKKNHDDWRGAGIRAICRQVSFAP
jgi:hypothetical protein